MAEYLARKVDCGTFQGRQAGVFSYYEVTQEGKGTIANNKEIQLPPISNQAAEFRYPTSVGNLIKENEVDRKKRVGHGSDPLSMVKMLIKSHDNWQEIITKEQYQFPGVSVSGQSNMLLYSKDVSKLRQYVASKPHFLWDDIQLSKGKLNPDRMVTMNINGIVFYCMAPCNGIKVCSAPDCSHAQPLNSKKNLCSMHPSSSTDKTSGCPVVFMYLFPQNSLMIIKGMSKEIIMSVVLM